jgi:4-hydroxy-3-methylbut-2-enyl diphosphate reductase IspH
MRLFESQREASTEVPASRGKAPLVSTHHMIVESAQEATIEAFLVAHEGHISEVEAQRGTWSIYCRCARCEDIHTYEVDNEARERAIGLPPWQDEDRKLE